MLAVTAVQALMCATTRVLTCIQRNASHDRGHMFMRISVEAHGRSFLIFQVPMNTDPEVDLVLLPRTMFQRAFGIFNDPALEEAIVFFFAQGFCVCHAA